MATPKREQLRPRPLEKTLQVGLRVPLSTIARIDRYADRLRVSTRLRVTRTDAAVALMERGLDVVERRG